MCCHESQSNATLLFIFIWTIFGNMDIKGTHAKIRMKNINIFNR